MQARFLIPWWRTYRTYRTRSALQSSRRHVSRQRIGSTYSERLSSEPHVWIPTQKSGPPVGERLTRLAVSAFRGVPDRWELEFPDGNSMVVLGDNGTGKSTIADALDWYFRGRIEFLAKEGRDRALRHVGASKAVPTLVEVSTTGSLGGQQRMPTSGPWLPARVTDNFVLRGRTLSDFVEQPKAQKWKTLADILGLEEVDRLRLDLQTVRNQLEDEENLTRAELRRAAAALRGDVQRVDDGSLFTAIQAECSAAGVAPPSSLEDALDPTWAAEALGTESATRAASASTLLADIEAAKETRIEMKGVDAWNTHLGQSNPADTERLRFMNAAEVTLRSQPDDGICPLCGQPANRPAIIARVVATLEDLKSAAEAHEQAAKALNSTLSALADHRRSLGSLRQRSAECGIGGLPDLPAALDSQLSASLTLGAPVPPADLELYVRSTQAWLDAAETAVGALPPAPSREAGLVRLVVLAERGRRWRLATTGAREARAAFSIADRLYVGYQRVEMDHYSQILRTISSRVAELYSFLHPHEGFAGVSIEPWTEKGLELALDFHGTHHRPPHGVLSESHLNSLAVSLFLAMAEIFNEQLDLVVLDDVINSFDVEHRGRLAELLVTEFGKRQLIVLTHDHQFFQHLTRRARSWATEQLTSWAYDEGPRTARYSPSRFTNAARQALADGDIHGGAAKSRRALEEILDEACESLEAPLPYRRGEANDRRELGELMSGLRSRLKTSANSFYRELKPLLTDLDADVQAALNVEVHAGRGWASSSEVEDALARVDKLDKIFTCQVCGSHVWAKGNRDAKRCMCGAFTYPPSAAGGRS
jgi:energy-coupling factor transporter ATP-binding protein EcfA2